MAELSIQTCIDLWEDMLKENKYLRDPMVVTLIEATIAHLTQLRDSL